MDSKPPQKFGRVFLRNSDGSYDLLPSASFCGLTLRFYNPQGEIHPEFLKHSGKPFKISVKFQSTDKSGAKKTFEAHFKYPLGLGENYCADLDYFEKLLQMEIALSKETGIIYSEKDKICDFIKVSQMSAYLLFTMPGEEVLKLRPVVMLGLFSYLDSVFDNYKKKSKKTPPSYWERCRVLRGMIQAQLEGKGMKFSQILKTFTSNGDSSDDDLEMDSDEILGAIRSGEQKLKYFTKLREALLQDLPESEGKEAVTKIVSYFEAEMFSKCREWLEVLSDKNVAPKLIDFQSRLHLHTTGVFYVTEIINLLQGIRLKPETRGMLAVKMFEEQLALTSAKLNSLFSYEKEFTKEEFHNNEVIMLHTVGNLELEEAQQRMVDDINRCVETAQGLKELILKFKKEDDMIEKYVEKSMNVLGAGIQWNYYTKRYHDVEVVDCYIDV